MAKKFPDTHFAITDYSVEAAPFADKKGKLLFKNVEGLTYAANESGCLVGVLAAKMAQKGGKKIIGAVGGLKIPPVDIWIAGYRYCAKMAVPGTKVLVGYSQDFVAADKCKTVAENQIAQGAQVLFQVAGGCGLGTLKAADEAGIWGIGVDVGPVQRREARPHERRQARRHRRLRQRSSRSQAGKFAGRHRPRLQPRRTAAWASARSTRPCPQAVHHADERATRQQIIAGKLKVPRRSRAARCTEGRASRLAAPR